MTDWFGEISQTAAPPKEVPASGGGTNWYSEMVPGGSKFNELSNRAPWHVKEPGDIARLRSGPTVPGDDERLYVVDNPKYGAGLGLNFKMGFADKWESLIPAAAKARFPNMPIEDAKKRYGLVDGNLVYVGDDGNLYREFASQSYIPKSIKEAMNQLVQTPGAMLPDVAGTVAGVLTAPQLAAGPAGIVSSIRTTAAAQAGGEAVRQSIGKLMLNEDVSAGKIAAEAIQGGIAQVGAGAVTGVMNRFAARDITRLDKAATTTLEKKAEKFNIPLTPAEKTNLPSLKAQQRAMSNLPQSADVMDDFYRARGESVAGAVDETLGTIAADQGSDAAGMAARKAAGGIVDDMTAERAKQAKPLYEAAFANKARVDVRPVLSYIDDQLKEGARGSIRSTLERVKEVMKVPGTDRIDTSIQGLHNAKIEIDNMISKASTDTSIGRVAKAKLVEAQKQLVSQIEAVSDDYAKARGLYADVSPGIDKVREGVVGILSEITDDNLYKAGRTMLDPGRIGPTAVRNARAAFVGAGKEDQFNGLVRHYLQEQFEIAGREYATAGGISTQGAKFRAAVMGNPKQREILRAAMKPEQFAAFSDLMDVLEATGRAARVGSDTAWNQEAMREIRRQSGGVPSNILAPHQIPGRLRDWYEQVKLGNYAENLANIITSPDAMKKLKQLRQVSPRTARANVIAADALGLLAESGIDSILAPHETRLPESYDGGGGAK